MPTLAEGAGPRSLEKENEEKKRILKSDANSPELLLCILKDCRLSSRRTNLKHDYIAWSRSGRSRSMCPRSRVDDKKNSAADANHHATDSRPETSAHVASMMSRGLRGRPRRENGRGPGGGASAIALHSPIALASSTLEPIWLRTLGGGGTYPRLYRRRSLQVKYRWNKASQYAENGNGEGDIYNE